MSILRLASNCLEKMDSQKRFSIVEGVYKNAQSLYISLILLGRIGREHGKYDQQKREFGNSAEPFFNLNQIEKLEKICLESIQKRSETDLFINEDNLLYILFFWNRLSNDSNPANEWVKKNLGDYKLVLSILKYVVKGSISLESLKSLVNIEDFSRQLKVILKSDSATQYDKEKIESFFKTLES